MDKVLTFIKETFVYFLCFAIIGWIYEEVLFIVEKNLLVNRGFLYGPWLPVYGFGGTIMYFLFYHFKKKPVKIGKINIRPLLIFIYVTLFAMFVELLTTYICDIVNFDWKTLWQYDDKFMNFQGRIALEPGLRFGLIGLLGAYIIIPLVEKFLKIDNKVVKYITYIIMAIFVIDVIIHIFTGSNYTGPV